MNKIFTFIGIIFLSYFTFSQSPSDKWFFGANAGLDFTGGGPVAISGSPMNIWEGCSSVSDASGNLLFYTNGINVWNKNNAFMTNGNGLMGNPTTSQVLIVPTPSNVSQYYIFYADAQGGPNGFRYSIVDMSLSSGLGSVTTKNTLLFTPSSEKMTAVKDPFSNRYWIVAHQFGNNNFNAYELNLSGLQTPIISSAGMTYSASSGNNAIGQLKFNNYGNLLATATAGLYSAEIFNFNLSTGQITNPITLSLSLPSFKFPYGVEFSCNSKKLYVTTADSSNALLQFDLTVYTPSAIAASQTTVTAWNNLYALQLASNGKIYVSNAGNSFISAINFPNLSGTSSNFILNSVNLDPSSIGFKCNVGLPGFVQSYFNTTACPSSVGIRENYSSTHQASIFPNPSHNDFNLKLNIVSTIKIYSLTGKLVEEFYTDEIIFGFNYSPGLYFVRVENSQESYSIKVLKD